MTGYQILSRLFKDSVKPYSLKLSSSFFFMIITALSTGLTAWILDPAIKMIFLDKNTQMLTIIPIAIIITLLIKGISTYWQTAILTDVGQRIIADTQIKMFSKITYSDLAWVQKNHSGKIISNFLYDVTLLQDSVSNSLANGVRDILTLICLIAVMYYQDWRLATVSLIAIPLVALLSKKLGKRMKKASTEGQVETGILATLLSENLDGTRVVKAYQQEEREIQKVSLSIYKRMHLIIKGIKTRAAASPFSEFLAGFGIAAALYYAGVRGIQGELALNEFVSFLGAMMLSFQPLKRLSAISTSIQDGFAAAVRIFNLMDQESYIKEADNANQLVITNGKIEFKDVSLSYENNKNLAISNISLIIEPGTTTALVGPSGAGKSSCLNLIPRFYDPSNGSIEIDEQNIKHLTLDSLRSCISLVSQEPKLFDVSIKENISYGNISASYNEIVDASKSAAAHEFIMSLPNQYETIVGEKGFSLSGGQKQRISIARAFLRDAPILLLDEATSSLDNESENLIQIAIKKLMQNRTTIVIAHRLSTIIDANKIAVFDSGKIAEIGTHQELIKSNGIYSNLYKKEI
ncbi:MAG: ABC transporter ATP-binding protein [Candidatus Pelagibacterales bacterium]|jgi:subfamily B ATP-binding cassette protein MsbA|tara:strand:- start:416 stop:2146 length:1731 start_codon:yes stop_codon:yes gene_type:complete